MFKKDKNLNGMEKTKLFSDSRTYRILSNWGIMLFIFVFISVIGLFQSIKLPHLYTYSTNLKVVQVEKKNPNALCELSVPTEVFEGRSEIKSSTIHFITNVDSLNKTIHLPTGSMKFVDNGDGYSCLVTIPKSSMMQNNENIHSNSVLIRVDVLFKKESLLKSIFVRNFKKVKDV